MKYFGSLYKFSRHGTAYVYSPSAGLCFFQKFVQLPLPWFAAPPYSLNGYRGLLDDPRPPANLGKQDYGNI